MTHLKEKTFKNISYSLVSFVYPIVLALFLTPIIVHYFGIKEYGIYIFINTLISLVGVLDLGISTAITKLISEYSGRKDVVALSNLFKTANSLFFLIGLFGAILIVSSIFFGLVFFPNVTADSYALYAPAFVYAGILFFLNSINSLYAIIPSAYQRFDVVSKIGVVFISLQQMLILAVIFFQGSLNTLFLLQVLLTGGFYFVYKKKSKTVLLAEERDFIQNYGWDKKQAIKCYTFGVASFLNNLSGSSLTYLDRIIIPIFLGPSNLAYYSLSGGIANKIPSLSTALSSVIFPMASSFHGGEDIEMLKKLYIRSMRLITIISVAVLVSFVAFSYQLLYYWINKDLADNALKVFIILSVTNFILAITSTLNSFLLGVGRLKVLNIASFSAAVLNIVLLLFLLPFFGITGAAWAYLLALTPYIFLLYETEKKYLNLSFRKKYYITIISRLVVTSFIVFCIDFLILKPLISTFLTVILFFLISCSLFIAIYYLFGFFEKEDTYDILNFMKQKVLIFSGRFSKNRK